MPTAHSIDGSNSISSTLTVFTADTVRIKQGGFIHAGSGAAIQADRFSRTSEVQVVVEGSLTAHAGAALSISGSGNMLHVKSTGTVYSGGASAFIGETGMVVNEGTISSKGGGDYCVAIAASQSLQLYNTGIIRNDNYGASSGDTEAVRGGTDDDAITNAGFIRGIVHLSGGNDIYDGRNGLLDGVVELSYGNDKAYGGIGSETFKAAWGDDFVDGGAGNDTVLFSGARADYVIESNSDGSLKIRDTREYQDGTDVIKNIEFLKFSDQTVDLRPSTPPAPTPPVPPAQLALTNKVFLGTKGKDALVGGTGNDKLSGGSGNDVLTGDAGQDVFVFNAKLGTAKTDRKVNFDTITDFKPGEDKIWLDNAVFKKLGKGSEAAPGALSKAFFKMGAAKDGNDFLLYDKKAGVISYDADGNGTRYDAVEVFKVSRNLSLTADDFRII